MEPASSAGADMAKQAVVSEVLGRTGQLYSQPSEAKEVLCRPKILPIKSITLEKIECQAVRLRSIFRNTFALREDGAASGRSSRAEARRPFGKLSTFVIRYDSLTPALRLRAFPLDLYDSAAVHEGRTPEEWLVWCAEVESTGQTSADVLHFFDGHGRLIPCNVCGYDNLEKRFLVCVPSESYMFKRVKRLHLRFRCEDTANFTARLESARRSRDAAMLKLETGSRLRKYCQGFGIAMPLKTKNRLGDICIRLMKKLLKTKEDKSMLQNLCEVMLNQLFDEVETDYKMTLTKHSMGVRVPKILPSLTRTHLSSSVFSQSKKFRRTRFSLEFFDTVFICRGKFDEVAALRILDTDWCRSQPSQDPKHFLFSGRGRLGAVSKGWEDRLTNDKLLRRRSSHAAPLRSLTLPEFTDRSKLHAEGVTVTVQRHWRECAVRVVVDKLAGALNFLRDDTVSHLRSPQHRICAVIDTIIGDMVSQWMEKCVTDWVEIIENPSSFPLIKIELDLSESGQIVLSPSAEEIQEVFEQVLENVFVVATELPTLEPELFPHCQIPLKPLGTVDSELIVALKARLRSALLSHLEPAFQLLVEYQPFDNICEVAAELSESGDDLSAARRVVEWSRETKDAIYKVCPGGVQSKLFVVDTTTVTERLINIVEKTKQGILTNTVSDAETKARSIEHAYGSLREKLNTTPSEEEVEGLLVMVETIEEQSLVPLDHKVEEFLQVLEFFEGSEFIVPLELLRASFYIRNAPVQARNNLKLFCKRLQSQNRRRLRRLNDDE